ncbi:MAG: TlyA family RNA methyltransferase [Candidatus Ancillula sp.]|jgi:23S rRNA (cytidine1920-2'-O)/16S rRNA (cytidine1409-2'-O)-methyltransferase|nr:TlyA family RNA methyltransferase [Candidatus Ancillula sp.]
MRLDIFLVENGFVTSRTRAQQLIKNSMIQVIDNSNKNTTKIIKKPAFEVTNQMNVQIINQPGSILTSTSETAGHFVSRAALKLVTALDEFNINPANLKCLDIGASTGGFTQVLIDRGAQHLTALDVGHDQLSPILLTNPKYSDKLTNIEGQNIRTYSVSPEEKFDLIVSDVSFISLTFVIEKLPELLKSNSQAILLIKPQFEIGKDLLKQKCRGGVVSAPELRELAIEKVTASAKNNGLKISGLTPSKITGKDGNQEYLLWLKN